MFKGLDLELHVDQRERSRARGSCVCRCRPRRHLMSDTQRPALELPASALRSSALACRCCPVRRRPRGLAAATREHAGRDWRGTSRRATNGTATISSRSTSAGSSGCWATPRAIGDELRAVRRRPRSARAGRGRRARARRRMVLAHARPGSRWSTRATKRGARAAADRASRQCGIRRQRQGSARRVSSVVSALKRWGFERWASWRRCRPPSWPSRLGHARAGLAGHGARRGRPAARADAARGALRVVARARMADRGARAVVVRAHAAARAAVDAARAARPRRRGAASCCDARALGRRGDDVARRGVCELPSPMRDVRTLRTLVAARSRIAPAAGGDRSRRRS